MSEKIPYSVLSSELSISEMDGDFFKSEKNGNDAMKVEFPEIALSAKSIHFCWKKIASPVGKTLAIFLFK